MNKPSYVGNKNQENDIDDQKYFDQVFDYKSFMSCISNTLKKEDEILDSSFFDALMGIEFENQGNIIDNNNNNFNNINSEQTTNEETINTQKILNQLLISNHDDNNNQTDQIEFLLESGSATNSRSNSSSDKSNKITKRTCKRSRYTYENEESTQDTIDSDFASDNDYLEVHEVKRKGRTSSRTTTITTAKTTTRTSRRRLSTDTNISCKNETYKKESNKEAATRYRIKKLSEKDQLFETKEHLEKQNDETKKKIDHVQTEINYLKNLLCQVLLTKGILA